MYSHSSYELNINEEDKKIMIPSDVIMISNFNSDQPAYKEFVMKEDGNDLKLVRVVE